MPSNPRIILPTPKRPPPNNILRRLYNPLNAWHRNPRKHPRLWPHRDVIVAL
ncbi:hypothetical protein HDU99_006947, partial [Rhizoclosmatium hyalinum]